MNPKDSNESLDSFFYCFLTAGISAPKAGTVRKEIIIMKHVQTLNTKKLQNTVKKGGCGECQTSCQSACKTSCTVGNQSCENNR